VNERRRAAALAVAALAVGQVSSSGPGRDVDLRAFAMLNADRGRTADALFGGITELGSIWAAAGGATALAAAGRSRAAGRALGAASVTWLLGQGLKKAFRRPRPYAVAGRSRLLIGEPRGTSWPSSHPMVLLAWTTVACRELRLGPAADRAVLALASAVGLSRISLGVHHPSDVAGGLLLGRAVGLAWGPPNPSGRR
jgi:undecaprenyl-diphosphatase